jgi:predicted glycosyltransferase
MPQCHELGSQSGEGVWGVSGQHDAFTMMTYSHDGYGLGHMRRNSTIAARTVQRMPHSSVLMLIGCPVGAFFELPPGVDFVKVPSIIKVAAGTYQPLGIRVSSDRVKMIRAATIAAAAETLEPNIFLVDHVPIGVWGELLPTLHMLKARKNPPHIVLGIRDIIDSPGLVREQWHREGTFKTINTYYDEVLIYGCEKVFDAASAYGLRDEVRKNITYCGYVCSNKPHKNRDQMRRDLELTKDKLVLVMAGGGHDGYPMMQACMDAFRLLGKDRPFEVMVIAGPLMEHSLKKSLRRQGAELNARVLSHVHESLGYLEAADLVITMAGYNSICEILSLKKRALVIPREGPRAEQKMRSRILADRGTVDVLYPHELSSAKLAARIIANLELTDCDTQTEAVFDTDGADYVATLIAERARHCARRVPGVANQDPQALELPMAFKNSDRWLANLPDSKQFIYGE